MSFFHSLTASLDDIVFEGRNQAYGAYQLRQDYRRHLASAGALTLGLGLLLWLVGLAWPTTRVPLATPHPVELDLLNVKPPVIEHPKVAPATPPAARAAAGPHVARPTLPTEVVPDRTPQLPAKPQPPEPSVDAAAGLAGPTATPGLADGGNSTGPATGPATGGPGLADGPSPTESSSAPFLVVEKMPEFAGGQAALLRYLSQHLRYPAQALRTQTEGKVYLSFVVKADGTIAEAAIIKGLSAELDAEALRVVRQMPAWTPGYQSKHPVAVRFTLPISFQIQ